MIGRAVLAAVLALLCADPARPQERATLAEFAGLDAAAAGDVQLRVAPLAAGRGLPGLLVATSGGSPDTSALAGHVRPGHPVVWVESRAVRAEVAPQRMLAALSAIAALPEAAAGAVDSMGVCLLSLARGRGDSLRVYEVSLDRESAARLFRDLALRLGEEPRVWDALAVLACAAEVASGPAATAHPALSARLDRLRYDPVRRELSGRLVVVNRGREAVPAPIEVAIRPRPSTIRLVEPDGITCRVFDRGTPFVRVPVEGGLAPGAGAEREVRFVNRSQANARFDLEVFAGPADR